MLHQFLGRNDTDQNDHANFAMRQFDQLGGQTVIQTIREAVFDSDIAAFGVANVSKATAD